MSTETVTTPTNAAWPDYRAVWRWHFYAGVFCIPFVLILSLSGSFYLFKTEIEAWEERRFDSLSATGTATLPSQRVEAVLKANPEAQFNSYELPTGDTNSTRVIVRKGNTMTRVFVHPTSLEVLGELPEQDRFMRIIRRIHGELLLGPQGSYLVELAACWTIVMILTGIYLWWPRNAKGWGGILYPRLGGTSKVFWRDLHSVPGMWISGMAMVLLLSGLPWSNFWGDYFKSVRRLTGTSASRQDWSNRGDRGEGEGEHQGHGNSGRGGQGGRGQGRDGQGSGTGRSGPRPAVDLAALDLVVTAAECLELPAPVGIFPPSREGGNWSVRSNTPNRPLRVSLTVDGSTGEILSRENFTDRHPIDQIVGYGIAIHEGRLFGIPNQILGLITALGLVLLSVSGVVLWWKRRDRGVLGAPHPAAMPRLSWGLLLIVIALGIYLPMFGASLIGVLLLERLALRHAPGLKSWLGLRTPSPEQINAT